MIYSTYQLDSSKFRGSSISNGFAVPNVATAPCPYCGMTVAFSISNVKLETNARAALSSARCPNCSDFSSFTFFFAKEKDESGNFRLVSGSMFPSPRQSMLKPDLSDEIPQPLKRALFEAVDSYNAGLYSATATLGRRSLEGIFKHLSSSQDNKKKLFQLIEEMKSSDELASPIIKLSHAIREGGNLGAHFDLEREADEETARHIVELVVYLMGFFFLLPEKISDLEKRVK